MSDRFLVFHFAVLLSCLFVFQNTRVEGLVFDSRYEFDDQSYDSVEHENYVLDGWYIIPFQRGRETDSFPLCVDGKETFTFPLHKGFPVQVSGKLRTSIVVADVDNNGQMELCFSLDGKTHLLQQNGLSYDSSWPQVWGYRTPAIVDIDNDGQKEIITAGPGQNLSVWKLDGSLESGWPYEFQYGGPSDSVSVLDMNRDKSQEITVGSGSNPFFLGIIDPNGCNLTGFPIEVLDNISYSPGLADLDSDGTYEVIVGHDDYFADIILAYDILGNLFQGNWSVDLGGMGIGGVQSNIVVADIDGDQRPEILFATDVSRTEGHIDAVILNHDKSFAQGWPKELHTWAVGGLTVGDIDCDGRLEVACATILGPDGPLDYSKVYVWNGEDGTDLPGWPKTVMDYDMTGNVIIGDIDGDCDRELLIAGFDFLLNKTQVFAWHSDGSDVAGFPLTIEGFIVYGSSSCFIADIDNDSLVEIGIGVKNDYTDTSRIYVWDLPYKYRKDCQDWPQYRHDCQHTGNYHFPEGLPIFQPVPTLPWPALIFLLAVLSGFLIFRKESR